jgi:hypothetical protein
MYVAVKRQGLDRASRRDITYCTTWLRERGWRRVQKHLPDGQRVVVWRPPGGMEEDPPSRKTQAELGSSFGSSFESSLTEKASRAGDYDSAAGHVIDTKLCSGSTMPGKNGEKEDPRKTQEDPKISQKIFPINYLVQGRPKTAFFADFLKVKILKRPKRILLSR